MSINDVVIHVNETLDRQAQRDLEERIRQIDGVIAPRFNDRRPHLMIVAYVPEHTRTKEFSMSINDVVIHVNETLDSQAQRDLEDRIRQIDGVIAPRFNDRRPHLMIVAYVPEHTRTKEFIDVIQRQGYHAQHCGA